MPGRGGGGQGAHAHSRASPRRVAVIATAVTLSALAAPNAFSIATADAFSPRDLLTIDIVNTARDIGLDPVSGYNLYRTYDVAVFTQGDTTYAAAVSTLDHTVQLIQVHGNGTLSPADAAANGTRGFDNLYRPINIDAFVLNGSDTYLLANSYAQRDPAVQLIRVHVNGTLSAADSVAHGERDFDALLGPRGIATFVLDGNRTHALVGSIANHGTQLIRIYDNGTLEAADSAFNGTRGFDALGGATGIGVLTVNGSDTYALVASTSNAVQLIRVHDNGTLEAADSAFNGTRGFDALGGATGIGVLTVNGSDTYALVASTSNAVQLIRVHDNGTLEAADSAFDGDGAFVGLEYGVNVDTFTFDGDTYAMVVGYSDYAVQLIRVHDNGTLEAAGSASLSHLDLGQPYGIDAFALGNETYAMVGHIARFSGGAVLLRVGPPSPLFVTGVDSEAADGSYREGAAINITVRFSGNVSVSGAPAPALALNTGGSASYLSGNGTRELTFHYMVEWYDDEVDDLDYDGVYALSGGGSIAGTSGDRANLALYLPGSPGSLGHSRDIRIDNTEPFVVSVESLSPAGFYGWGSAVRIAVTFSEPVVVGGGGGVPMLELETGETDRIVEYVSGSGTHTLVFNYTVQEGDFSPGLQYTGTSALSDGGGSITDAAGNVALLGLPDLDSESSLGGSGFIVVPNTDGSEIVTALALDAAGSAVDGADGFAALGGATDVDVLAVNGSDTYAIVASRLSDGVQLIRIYDNGTLEAAGSVFDGPSVALDGATGVAVLSLGDGDGDAYAAVASYLDDAVLLIRIYDNGTLQPVSSARDGAGGFDALGGALGIDAFDVDGRAYAAVASHRDSAVQLIRIYDNGTLEAAGLARDGTGGFDALGGARAVDVLRMGDETFVIVASFLDDAVQLIQVHNDGTLEAVDSAFDGMGGFDALDGAAGVAAFDVGNGDAYAAVASYHDDAVQLIRIHGNGTLEAAGSVVDGGAGGGGRGHMLDGAHAVEALDLGGGTAVLVSSFRSDAVELIRVGEDGTLQAAGSAADGGEGRGSFALDGASGMAAFGLDGRTYAAVASYHGDAVQLIEAGAPPSIVGVAAPAGNGTYALGEAIDIAVRFSGTVSAVWPLELRLNNGHVLDRPLGSGTDTLTFRYTVGPVDAAAGLDYAGTDALSGSGMIIGALGGDADRALPPPGSPGSLGASSDIAVDGIAPSVSAVSPLGADGTYGIGSVIRVAVEFSEPVLVGGEGLPVLGLALGLPEGRNATYASGSGTATLVFEYTVQEGDSSPGLDYSGASALLAGGAAIADEAGNAARLALPEPGSGSSLGGSGSIVVVDAVQPRADAPLMAAAGSVTGGWLTDPRTHICSLADAGSATGGASGFCLWGARHAAVFDLDGGKYALVAALRNDTVQLVRIYENGTIEPKATASQGRDGFTSIDGPYHIDVFEDDGSTYALVASRHGTGAAGLQLIHVRDANTLEAAGALTHTRGFYDVEVFVLDGETHALAVSSGWQYTDSVRLFRVDPDAVSVSNRIESVYNVYDSANVPGYLLASPQSVDVFTMNDGETYAVVASRVDGAVQLIRVHDNGTLKLSDSAVDDGRTLPARNEAGDGYFALNWVGFVDAFALRGDRMYAIATSNVDHGVQLIRIHGNGTLSPAGYAHHGTGGFLLHHPNDAAAFTIGGDTYALVVSEYSNSAQLIRIHEDGALEAASSAVNGSAGFAALGRPHSISIFEMAGSVHATVATFRDDAPVGNDGIQLIRFAPPPNVTRVDFAAGVVAGAYAAGEAVDIVVGFSENVTVLRQPQPPPPGLLMGTGHMAPYYSGNNTDELTFRYTVQPGDASAAGLDYAGTGSLSAGGGGRIEGLDEGKGTNVSLALPPPGQLGAAGVRADGSPPRVLNVTARDAAHMEGAPIAVRVNFDEPVAFSGAAPSLALDIGGAAAGTAAYAGGNETATLTFVYAVGGGDLPAAARLGYTGTDSLAIPGGVLADEAGNPANLTLPIPGSPRSLGASNARIDNAAPFVQAVASASPDGAYGPDREIRIVVEASESIFVSGSPRLALDVRGGDGEGRHAEYAGGNGTDELAFAYTVLDGDFGTAATLEYAGSGALTAGGGTVLDAAGNEADLALPAPGSPESLTGSARVSADGVDPAVTGVTSPDGPGAHAADSLVNITVAFGERVFVTGTPRLALGTDPPASASYSSGNTSATLTFTYRVRDGDSAANLDYAGTGALTLGDGGAIRDAAGNSANRTLPAPGGPGSLAYSIPIAIDTTDPTVLSVSSPNATDTYGIGARIAISVNFTETVVVEGEPLLALETGDTDRQARYAAGSGSDMLAFLYIVRQGDNSVGLDYANRSALTLGDGGAITDAAGNGANLTLPAPGSPGSLAGADPIGIDTMGAGVLNVTSGTPDGAYRAGKEIDVRVVFSEAVVVGGTGSPALALDTGGTDRQAEYGSGSSSDTLTFLYTVQPGDNTGDLDYANESALALNGSTIQDTNGNNATRILPAPGGPGSLAYSRNIAIDTIDPSAESASSLNASRAYKAGARIAVNVTFSEPVVVAGSPTLAMETGDTDRPANYTAGSGSSMLTFVYTVRDGDNSANLDYANRTALALGGGSITDPAGNIANTTLPAPGGPGSLAYSIPIAIDTTDPTVLSVSSPNATDTYGIGARIAISVNFTETVVVEGEPLLALETGDTDRQARYAAGSNSSALTFLYQVRPGDMASDLDYNGTDALALAADAAILDSVGNIANTTLPAPGGPGSLAGAGSRITINGTGAGVLSVTSGTPDDAYMAGEVIDVRVVFSEDVVVGGAGSPALALDAGDTDRNARYDSGSNSTTLTFLYTVQPGDNTGDLDYANESALALNGSTIQDTNGNNATRILPAPGGPGSLAYSRNIAIDTIDPSAESAWSLNASRAYKAGARIAVNVTFDEPVVVAGSPTLAMETGNTDRPANYTAGSGSSMLTFVYTVRDGDNSANLDYANRTALALGGGSITDPAGNIANTTLPAPGGPGSLAYSIPIAIDTTDPTVLSVSSPNATDTYGIGARIAVNVTFDEPVVVAGSPTLAMETGNTDRPANYTAGSGSSMLTFVYTVRDGDNSANLDYANRTALALGGGSITDPAGNIANTTLPAPGGPGSLAGAGSRIAIDGTGAGVLRVTSGIPDGAYMAGEVIDIRVVFSKDVVVGGAGSPTLALDAGDTDRNARYDSGSNSTTLMFLYTVQPGDITDDLDYSGTGALALNGSTIRDAAGNNATLILPPPGDPGRSLAGLKDIAIDTSAPAALSASSTHATGTYGTGTRIAISVAFTEAVLVEGIPVLDMETGDTDRQAPYAEGSNSETLTFLYTVQDGDSSDDLDYANRTALTLGDGASSIKDAAGNNANLTLPPPGDDGLLAGDDPIRIETGGEPAGPARENATVLSAVFTARNTATITYSGSLDGPEGHEGPVYESVSITGGYTIGIAPENVTGLGSATHRIVFGGAGAGAGQAGTISLASELVGTASGGAILWFNDTTIPVAPGETVRVVEQQEPPPPPGAPPLPAVAIERDGFTRTINATGAGNGTRVAINVTGLAPLQPGTGALQPANATTAEFPAEPVRMIAVFAEVTFPANATATSVPADGLIVLYESDDVPPAGDIAAALGIADAGSLRVRQVVEIGDNATHIAFDRPVRILLPGQAGGSAFYVNNTDGAVVPIDTQCTGDSAKAAAAAQLGGAGECWIDLPGAAGGSSKVIYTYHLTRFGTAEAADSPPPPTAVDAPEPASVSVLQRPDGEALRAPASYVEGQAIIIAVDFSAPVTVDTTGGTPRLLLETGSAGAAAPYASGSGTDRLEFEYAVRGGDITGRLSYAGTGALDLGGGSISAAGSAATAASIALPPPGGPGSLSAPGSPAVRIDPIGRPVLGVGILDEGAAAAGHVSRAAYIAAAEFNERQGRTDGALLINATSYDAGGTADAAAAALRSAHSPAGGGAGPYVYVGPSTDRGLHAAMPYAANNDIVLVSAGSTAPSLAVADDQTFRLLPSDRLEAEALARLAYSGGDELVHAVLDNATYGPQYGSGARGGLANADLPPPQGAFAHAFGAALASAAISPLSGTVTLAGGAGVPYDGAAAAAALDASVQAASASGARPTSVVYLGSPEGLAALAGSSASYPALSSASWFASGLSAGSNLLAGDGSAAAGFAAAAGLSAARWSPPASAAGQAIDSRLPGMGPGERNSAYAAYDAVIVVGQAAVAAAAELGSSGDVPDAAAIADALPAAAAAHDGALGDIALDNAGDLWVPAVYDLWTVAAQPGGADPEWSRQQGELDGERACSITLTRAKIDYGPIDSGQTSRPHLQTIVNTGQLPFAQVDLAATQWHVDSPGNCEPGVEPSLPVGLSEVRTVQGGAFSDLVGSGTTLAQGLEAGSRAPLWYRLSLAGYADLPQAEITQCATYVVRCS